MSIKAVSFDFWGTLFTEAPGGFEWYKDRRRLLLQQTARECGFDFSNGEIEDACHQEARVHYRIWREEHRTLPVVERLGSILRHLGAMLPDHVVSRVVREYEEGILEMPPVLVSGAREALVHLASKYPLGIISDVGFSPGRVLRRVLIGEGLLDLFDSLVFSDEVGCSKPDCRVFDQAARGLGVRPAEMVHIGDLEHTDISGAKAAGCRAIRFTGVTQMEQGETSADHVTADLREVPALIDLLSTDHGSS